MAKNEMCPCYAGNNKDGGLSPEGSVLGESKTCGKFSSRKTIRMRCPECGRRFLVSPKINSDGDFRVWQLPPHKVKGWYKKKKVKG